MPSLICGRTLFNRNFCYITANVQSDSGSCADLPFNPCGKGLRVHQQVTTWNLLKCNNLCDPTRCFVIIFGNLEVLNVVCIQIKVTTNNSRTLHRHTKRRTNKFDTDLWWETGEFAEAAGSSLDGCKTNAITTEEPTSIIMAMNVKDMVHKPDGQSIG